jgi:hypothetical protein
MALVDGASPDEEADQFSDRGIDSLERAKGLKFAIALKGGLVSRLTQGRIGLFSSRSFAQSSFEGNYVPLPIPPVPNWSRG